MNNPITQITGFSERELKILERRFGIRNGITHTLEEVGKEFGVTRDRVRQIEAKALEKIRQFIRSDNPFAKWAREEIKKL